VSAPQNIIAVVFDFDDTLADDSTTALLKSKGIDTADFWNNKAAKLIADGWDPTPAYLKLILDHVGTGKPLGKLSNAKLREFGKGLRFYPGLPGIFRELKESAKEHTASNPAIEFYIISGGLEEVIKGSSIASHMSGIWGCNFAEENGQISHIKNLISFTEKTKYLYAIHKGVTGSSSPYAVNERVEKADRRIPFENMIYLGDGLTDVPCFSLLDHFGGKAFGVFDPKRAGASKKAWEGLLAPKRVTSMNAPKYRKNDELGALLRVIVKSMCLGLDAKTQAVRR
jgi:hypothetical protein